MSRLCTEPDCFNKIDEFFVVTKGDGTIHPTSLKCFECQTDEERKRLKAYCKHRRNVLNRKNKKLSILKGDKK